MKKFKTASYFLLYFLLSQIKQNPSKRGHEIKQVIGRFKVFVASDEMKVV